MTTEPKTDSMFDKIRNAAIAVLGILLCLYTLVEANFPHLQVQAQLAIFVMIGLVLCFLLYPVTKSLANNRAFRIVDLVLAAAVLICCGYIVIHSDELFSRYWVDNKSIGNRSGDATQFELVLGIIGTVLVLEATRRAIGIIVPILALVFIAHSYYCHLARAHDLPMLPGFLLPHSGQNWDEISDKAFLQSQGVFGTAAGVMFKYVFLFVVFGAFLEISGATRFIIDFSKRIFGRSAGGPAQVAVVGSGLMGSLSGSAVANAMTTGAFTIPMMKNAGFDKTAAGGITAAAATGGALVPPVMGAAAYMMLDLVEPEVTFTQVATAAAIPALLYYFSLWMIVHFYSRRMGAVKQDPNAKNVPVNVYDGLTFFVALGTLVALLGASFTVVKAVTSSLVVILLMTTFRKTLSNGAEITRNMRVSSLLAFVIGCAGYVVYCYFKTDELTGLDATREKISFTLDTSFVGMYAMIVVGLIMPGWRTTIVKLLNKSAKNGVSLVAASACVGIIIAIVDSTGIAQDFNSVIKGLVENYLILALIGIMGCSIILGMGVPSVVCYLLMATLMGGLLKEMGVIPLSAHMFIFYFGMMSMVTPPVALAAYASASIAEANIMRTAFAAFRFALVGFTLPFMFVYRPALLLLNEGKWKAWIAAAEERNPDSAELLNAAQTAWPDISNLVIALTAAIIGIIALAAGIAGYLRGRLSFATRSLCVVAAGLLLLPEIRFGGKDIGLWVNIAGAALFAVILFMPVKNIVEESVKDSQNAENTDD